MTIFFTIISNYCYILSYYRMLPGVGDREGVIFDTILSLPSCRFFCPFMLLASDKFSLFEAGSYYIGQASLDFEILLSQPPEFWEYRHVSPLPSCLQQF